ncbi:peptidase C15, pyroglutamyl peptidase I-like protein, partial [Macrolepiota fuliginosa MF-IS2]
DKDPAKPDIFRVLITGFGPYGQWEVNPSWLAVKALGNVVLQTDPANHTRASLADDKPPPPLDEKLLVPRPIHISTLEIPAAYRAIAKTVPRLHYRPPVHPENMEDQTLKPPENGYDFMFHIGLAGRGPLRLERCGHKLGYNMKDATGQYAPVVIPQPKDFSRRGPDGRPMTIAEKAERDRLALAAASEIQSNPPSDNNAKPNRGFGGPYEVFSDELNTDLDVTRIIQDMRQTGADALQTIYSSMDGGHFIGDFLYYCSLAESKRSANPYEKRRNTQVLFLHCAPVGHPLKSEEVTDAIKRIVLWVCNEIQV